MDEIKRVWIYFKRCCCKSGTIAKRAGKYFVSVLCELEETKAKPTLHSTGVGIDLGVKDFAVRSDGKIHKNINKTGKVKKIEKRLKREQRSLSRKFENLKREVNTLLLIKERI